jgi:hypothetical protein
MFHLDIGSPNNDSHKSDYSIYSDRSNHSIYSDRSNHSIYSDRSDHSDENIINKNIFLTKVENYKMVLYKVKPRQDYFYTSIFYNKKTVIKLYHEFEIPEIEPEKELSHKWAKKLHKFKEKFYKEIYSQKYAFEITNGTDKCKIPEIHEYGKIIDDSGTIGFYVIMDKINSPFVTLADVVKPKIKNGKKYKNKYIDFLNYQAINPALIKNKINEIIEFFRENKICHNDLDLNNIFIDCKNIDIIDIKLAIIDFGESSVYSRDCDDDIVFINDKKQIHNFDGMWDNTVALPLLPPKSTFRQNNPSLKEWKSKIKSSINIYKSTKKGGKTQKLKKNKKTRKNTAILYL